MDDAILAPTRHKLPARHGFNVSDYYRMAEAGILGWNDRVELIDGDLIDMAPIGSGHASTVDRLNQALFVACAGRAIVRCQGSVRLDDKSEPQPDFAILRPRSDFYAAAHPGPADILLLIEVAASSLRFDQTVKLPLYARAGIAETWIVDLAGRLVTVHRAPAGDGYGDVNDNSGDQIALALAPEIIVPLAALFG